MRIRSTKPEFWRSKTIAQLDWDVRLVLKGLESYVDDNGVGKDDLALIAADVFPRDLSASPPETLARLSEAISIIVAAELVVRYEWDGEELLYIDRWKEIQRVDKPNKGRFPRPDGTIEYHEPVNRESYRNPREGLANIPEVLAPGTGEQGNRGTEEQGNRGAGSVGATEVCHQSDTEVAPAKKCARHINVPKPPDCGACAAARRESEAWERRQARALAEQRAADLAAAEAAKQAHRDCPDCRDDPNGLVEADDGAVYRCDHPKLRKEAEIASEPISAAPPVPEGTTPRPEAGDAAQDGQNHGRSASA